MELKEAIEIGERRLLHTGFVNEEDKDSLFMLISVAKKVEEVELAMPRRLSYPDYPGKFGKGIDGTAVLGFDLQHRSEEIVDKIEGYNIGIQDCSYLVARRELIMAKLREFIDTVMKEWTEAINAVDKVKIELDRMKK